MNITANNIRTIEFFAQARNCESHRIVIYPESIEDQAMKTGKSKAELFSEAYVHANIQFQDYCQKHMMLLEQITIDTTDKVYCIYAKMGNNQIVNEFELV